MVKPKQRSLSPYLLNLPSLKVLRGRKSTWPGPRRERYPPGAARSSVRWMWELASTDILVFFHVLDWNMIRHQSNCCCNEENLPSSTQWQIASSCSYVQVGATRLSQDNSGSCNDPKKIQLVVKQATHTLLESGHIHMMEQLNNYSYTQLYTVIQCGAPKIARLVYNSNNYGLWYANNYSYGGL